MASPAISIIVPVYNSAGTIRKCVDSILSQTYYDWELILADNGSTDGVREILEEISTEDRRIKVIDVKEKGVSLARNAAIDSAVGAYICFVDSDDTLDPEYLQSLCDAKSSDLVVCGYYVDTVNSEGKAIKIDTHNPSELYWIAGEPKMKLQTLFEMGYMHFCWNKLFKRSVIEENNIRFKHIPVNEDYIFVLEYLTNATSINVIDRALYHWIRIIDNVSGVKSIPDNLHAIYNESHLATRKFLTNDSAADRIAYFSYEMIIYKYYEAIRMGRISKQYAFNKIDELVHNSLVRDSYKSYKPKSKGETLLYILMRAGLYKVHYYITQKILRS